MAVNQPLDWSQAPFPWQTSVWERANQWLETGRFPHALLLSGVAGSGKQLFATAFAARLLCREPQSGRACGRCPGCRQFIAGAHPDYHPVAIPEDKTMIVVEQIRALGQSLTLTSQYARGQVALLCPVDAMNANAANSLLKTLEEPTPGTRLLLVTAQPAYLPATIRSRCQRLSLQAPDPAPAVDWLNAHGARADWAALLGIAGGGPLLALAYAETPLMQRRLDFFRLLVELHKGRRNPLTCAVDLAREPPALLLRLLQVWVGDLIVLASGDGTAIINNDARELLQSGLQGLNLRELHVYLDHIGQAVKLAATPVNSQLMLEQLFMEWADGLRSLAAAPLAANAWGMQ